MDTHVSSPPEVAAGSPDLGVLDGIYTMKIQKENGKLITFGFLADATAREVDYGIRRALDIPKSSSYSISFKDNDDDVHIVPSGRVLKMCLVQRNFVKLDVRVRSTIPQPQPQSCNIFIKRGRDNLVMRFVSL